MIGFLQGFKEDHVLLEPRDDQAVRWVITKAVEVAMLGLPEQFNAIYSVLARHGQVNPSQAAIEYECIWKYSGLQPPDLEETAKDAIWIITDEELHKKGLAARRNFAHLPDWLKWDEFESFDETTIEKLKEFIQAGGKSLHVSATTGYTAMKASAGYAALIAIAYALNLQDVVARYTMMAFGRIHANQQATYLSVIPHLWRDYFLPGRLRDELGVSKEAVESYSQYVLDTAEKRFSRGPTRPSDKYLNHNQAQLLQIIDKNTLADAGYEDIDANPDVADEKLQKDTVMRSPATSDQILETEKRLGRPLPEELKEFMRLTNGCTRVKVDDQFFVSRLPPLEDMFLEYDDYMNNYGIDLLPGLPNDLYHKIGWPGMPNGGIAMYEHNGQGTEYVWILDAESIELAKENLYQAYEKVSDPEKATIDRFINYWYGSRQAFDAMQNHCYYQVSWGEGASAIYPTFKAYLAQVANESESWVETSPVVLPEDLRI